MDSPLKIPTLMKQVALQGRLLLCGIAFGCTPEPTNQPFESDVAVVSEVDSAFDSRIDDRDVQPLDAETASLNDFALADAYLWQPSGPPDLVLNEEALLNEIWFDEVWIDPNSCSLIERCVSGVGWRRLMRFTVAVGNAGAEDLFIGNPADSPALSVYSPCHEHYHLDDFARYDLRDGEQIIRRGHKQAFCLMDSQPMPNVDLASIRENARYNCRYQGISPGWEDVYGSELECQWIDITNVPPGAYELSVKINEERLFKDANPTNNEHAVPVVIPSSEIDQECDEEVAPSTRSHCGWRTLHTDECDVGELVRVGGGGCYGLGDCDGKTALRVCDPSRSSCAPSTALVTAENGCSRSECPYVEFACPESEQFVVWGMQEASLDLVVDRGPESLSDSCRGTVPNGISRLCGWTQVAEPVKCLAHRKYRLGCTSGATPCSKDLSCSGDPMLKVCRENDPCWLSNVLGQADDSCGRSCPEVHFRCPASGEVRAWLGAFDHRETFSCNLNLVLDE